jgi:hypothetical protein
LGTAPAVPHNLVEPLIGLRMALNSLRKLLINMLPARLLLSTLGDGKHEII